MLGNCRVSHLDEGGEPVGMRHPSPRIVIAAVSEGQAKETMRVGRWMISDDLKRDYGIDIGQLSITALGGRAQMDVLSASFRSAEGKTISFCLMNESHHLIPSNGGVALFETLLGNLAKGVSGMSRRMQITNAPMPGEDSVAERTRRAYQDQVELSAKNPGVRESAGLFVDSLEADYTAALDLETLRVIVPEIRGDSEWLDPESLIGFAMNSSIPTQRVRRMIFNQLTSDEDSLLEQGSLQACVDRIPLRPGDQITLGFDGARRRDSTALIACRLSDRKIFNLKIWERPSVDLEPDWYLHSDVVDSAVQEAFSTYNVLAFYADVALWESDINRWSDQFRDGLVVRASSHSSIGWDMRGGLKRVTATNELVMAAVESGSFKYDGDSTLTRHMLNVRRRHNNFGVSFGKESRDSPKKIDAYAATLLAFMAANDVAERGKLPEPKKSRRLLRRR